MKPILLFLVAFMLSALCGATIPGDAQSSGGSCTARDRIQLGQAGYTKAEVDDLCGRYSDIPFSHAWGILAGEGQPRWVQWCVTPQGRCSLNPSTSGYYPIGSPCNCYMPWGTYGGVAQ